MYIAFKWLLGLTLTMWLAMCGVDILVKRKIVLSGDDIKIRPLTLNILGNRTDSRRSKVCHTPSYTRIVDKNYNMAYLHCFMFVAGALVVQVCKNLNEITVYMKRELSFIFSSVNAQTFTDFSKMITIAVSNAVSEFYYNSWENIKNNVYRTIQKGFITLKLKTFQKHKINLMLLKINEMGEEKRNLAQLLLAAIHENKNIRKQYQVEFIAKQRLLKQIENAEKLIKDNRSRYVTFQQMYQVTTQENTFLKTRLNKVTNDKNEVQKRFVALMNEVYKSKNHELIAYCSRFIVNTKHNLLNTDIGKEIEKFLEDSQAPVVSSSNFAQDMTVQATNCVRRSSCIEIIERCQDTTIMLASEAPKVNSAGEYVWTVKDKNGLIEKLFECDYRSDCNTGDGIRRIREYSVYHDKDCLLDFTNFFNDPRRGSGRCSANRWGDGDIPCHRFLTSSEPFKRFMQNQNIVSTSIIPVPHL